MSTLHTIRTINKQEYLCNLFKAIDKEPCNIIVSEEETEWDLDLSEQSGYNVFSVFKSITGATVYLWKDQLGIERVVYINGDGFVGKIANSFNEYLQILISLEYISPEDCIGACINKSIENSDNIRNIIKKNMAEELLIAMMAKDYIDEDSDILQPYYVSCEHIAKILRIKKISAEEAIDKIVEAYFSEPRFTPKNISTNKHYKHHITPIYQKNN